MTEEQKRAVATFRFGVICDFVNGAKLDRGQQKRMLREKCARKWDIPFSQRTRISRSAILRWIKLYQESGQKIEALYPHDRRDRGKSRAMDEETCLSLIQLRKELPRITVPRLIEQMENRGLISPGIELCAPTVYRFLAQQGLSRPAMQAPEDRRKFEAELPNDLWQSDVMHGPRVDCGGKMKKSYLIAFIDDHSRLVPHGEFYLSEALRCYVAAFEKALLKRGLPRKLYVDNGAAFRSRHLEHITASLGISLIHAQPYQPQGKGKIERFFKSVRQCFLAGFCGNTLDELNRDFDCWLNEHYHQRTHRATGQSPFKRFTSHMECLRPAPGDLCDHFRMVARRKVAKDRTITLCGRLYEAPVALIGKRVELLYHEGDYERVEIRFNHTSYGSLRPVDVHVNCRVRRDKNNNPQIEPAGTSRYAGGHLWSNKED